MLDATKKIPGLLAGNGRGHGRHHAGRRGPGSSAARLAVTGFALMTESILTACADWNTICTNVRASWGARLHGGPRQQRGSIPARPPCQRPQAGAGWCRYKGCALEKIPTLYFSYSTITRHRWLLATRDQKPATGFMPGAGRPVQCRANRDPRGRLDCAHTAENDRGMAAGDRADPAARSRHHVHDSRFAGTAGEVRLQPALQGFELAGKQPA